MSRRTPFIVTGAVILGIASLVVVTGVVLAAVFGSGNALATGPNPVSTPSRALVSSVAEIDGLSRAPSGLGQARIEIDATVRSGGDGAFVGVGRAEDVDRYLAGADVDLVTDFEVSPFRLNTQHRPGSAVPGAPGDQSFWVARAEAQSGTARLSWPVQNGDYRVVVMNADGTAGVDVDGRFAVVLPYAFGISMTVLATGLGLGLVGLVLLTLGLTAPRPPRPPAPWAGSVPPQVPAPARPPVPAPVPPAAVPNDPASTGSDRSTA
jgi:hypothetical protein